MGSESVFTYGYKLINEQASLEDLVGIVMFIRDLANDVIRHTIELTDKVDFVDGEIYDFTNEIAKRLRVIEEVRNWAGKVVDAARRVGIEPRVSERVPGDFLKATTKLYETTANVFPLISKFGGMTAVIYSLRNTPLAYANFVYPDLDKNYEYFKNRLGLRIYRLDPKDGLVEDEDVLTKKENSRDDLRYRLSIVGYPDYPRWIGEARWFRARSYVSMIECSVPQWSTLCISGAETHVLVPNLELCGNSTLGGAITCFLMFVKRLWEMKVPKHLKINNERAREYLEGYCSETTDMICIPYFLHCDVSEGVAKICRRMPTINCEESLRQRFFRISWSVESSTPLHIHAKDVFLGRKDLVLAKIRGGYAYGFV